MTKGLKVAFDEITRHFQLATVGADLALRKLINKLLAADPEETLVGNFDDRTELSLSAGWIGSRVAYLERESSDVIILETAACLIAAMFEDPVVGAANAGLLSKWPSTLARLVAASRERINGTGEPHGRSGRELSMGSQRVAIAVEAARRLSVAGGKLEPVLQTFDQEAERGYWLKQHVVTLPAAIAGLSKAFDDRRLEPVRSRTYRISTAHPIAAPVSIMSQQQRQRLVNRHVAFSPATGRKRVVATGPSRTKTPTERRPNGSRTVTNSSVPHPKRLRTGRTR